MNRQMSSKVIIISVLIISIGVTASILYQDYSQGDILSQSIRKAAILDQLYDDFPNESFQNKATEYLEAAGYQVELYTTDEITVDFYKELPSLNYEFIVLRTHGGPGEEGGSTTLTTGEKFRENIHLKEILNEQIGASIPIIRMAEIQGESDEVIRENSYFDINSKLVDNAMEGRFSDTVLVIGGCSALNSTMLAESFVSRGASSVVGWSGLVGDKDNDRITLQFLKEVLVNEIEIDEAVDLVMNNYRNSIEQDSTLLHYSAEN